MNPEPAPEITNPPPEKTFPERTAETGEARPKKKPGRLIRFVRWFDRGLDLEGRDTSDWNTYYYYFRQVAQHRAPVKLKYLKWFALVFQLYFFGTIIFAIINGILAASVPRGAGEGFEAIPIFGFIMLGLAGLASNLLLLLPMLLVPVLVVAPAFRLRSKNRALITSRAKEPPLLAHLVQYTTHKGLVPGALQSMIYTWKRLLIQLSPCLVVLLLLLIVDIAADVATGHFSLTVFHLATSVPACVLILILAISMFLLMQPFCYRLDSVILAVGIGIETISLLGIIQNSIEDFWILSPVYILSCLFAIVYFPLAAADTGEHGLGKSASKWLRILLYTAAGVFLAFLLLMKSFPDSDILNAYTSMLSKSQFFELLSAFLTWGLFFCVSGLLITSISVTSPLAGRQFQTRAKEPFLRKLFDPASPLSLIPVFALELIALATFFLLFRLESMSMQSSGYHQLGLGVLLSWGNRARNVWTAIHIGLVFAYIRQRRKQEMKPPWEFNVFFNMTTLVSYVTIQLILTLIGGLVGFVLYIASVIVLFAAFGFLKSPNPMLNVSVPPAEPEQDKEKAP